MDLTLNFSSDPLKSESELESSLKEPEFISKIPDLVIFPEIINFKNIIVGTTAHQKIILTNSSAEQKEITISINADPSSFIKLPFFPSLSHKKCKLNMIY